MNSRNAYLLAITTMLVLPARAAEPPLKLPSTPIAAGQGIALQKLVPTLLKLKKQDLTIEFWIKPDKSAIEDLLKGAKKEEILRVQKLVNARVAALDEGQSPPNGSGVPAADGDEGGNGRDAAETAPLRRWRK